MKNTCASTNEKIDPDSVLEIIKDSYFQQCQYDPEAEPDIELTVDSTIEDWRFACDLISWRPLGKAINEWFGIKCTEKEWREVLEPPENKTLSDVCNLISKHAERYAIKPFKICGSECLSAGIFISLKATLKDSGLPIEKIKPSTILKPFLISYFGEFSIAIEKLAPGILPPVKIEESFIQKLWFRMLMLGILLGLINLFLSDSLLSLISISISVFAVLVRYLTYRLPFKNISYGNLETFRDLCLLINKSKQ
jgi:hypothetical protein